VAGGELRCANGTVRWDGIGTVRLRYDGSQEGLDPLTRTLWARLGERVVPVEALRSVEVDAGVLRFVLREHADPLRSVAGGAVDVLGAFPCTDLATAEQISQEIRVMLTRRDVPATPATRWLVAPPVAPDRIGGRDATLSVASGHLHFTYERSAGRKKKSFGSPWSVPLDQITHVEWAPAEGRQRGYLRISTAGTPDDRPKPKHDPAAMVTHRGEDVDALFFTARLLTRIRP
jgi:hypothetical protein